METLARNGLTFFAIFFYKNSDDIKTLVDAGFDVITNLFYWMIYKSIIRNLGRQ